MWVCELLEAYMTVNFVDHLQQRHLCDSHDVQQQTEGTFRGNHEYAIMFHHDQDMNWVDEGKPFVSSFQQTREFYSNIHLYDCPNGNSYFNGMTLGPNCAIDLYLWSCTNVCRIFWSHVWGYSHFFSPCATIFHNTTLSNTCKCVYCFHVICYTQVIFILHYFTHLAIARPNAIRVESCLFS